jgi:hypothetical protein
MKSSQLVDDLAMIITLENGIPLEEARGSTYISNDFSALRFFVIIVSFSG